MPRESESELALRRIELGYTQNTLARAMGDTPQAQSIAQWESGTMPRGDSLLIYARLLGLTPAEVVAMVEAARAARKAVAR